MVLLSSISSFLPLYLFLLFFHSQLSFLCFSNKVSWTFYSLNYFLLLVRVFGLHFLWFMTFSVATSFRALACLFVLYTGRSYYLAFRLFSTSAIDLKVIFVFDYISLSFMTTVLFISSIIMIYSFNYMSPYSKPSYFL